MKFLVFFIGFLLVSSCVKNNPDPSWITLATWELVENPEEEGIAGELSNGIKDAYISVNGKVIGFFELPVKLPLLMTGEATIIIYPVIRNNGIAATKKIYPFCKPYTITTNLIQNEIVSIHPTTYYESGLEYWIEDFEGASFDISTSSDSKAILIKDNVPNYLKYGSYYGYVKLTSQDSTWIGSSIEFANVPIGGAEVYLEMDYMTNNTVLTALNVSINGSEKSNPNIQLNPFDFQTIGWKKIYIDLKELVSSYPNASYYKHYFTASLDAGKTESEIIIDNVRFIYKK